MFKNILKILAVFIIGMVGGIFADQIFWPYLIAPHLLLKGEGFYQYRLEKAPIYVTERKEITIQENTALKEAFEKVEKVVIGVKTLTKKGKTLEGSAFILTSDGLVITLSDLVPAESTTNFFIEGENPSFQILKRDLKENLVLVKIEKGNLPTTSFGNLEKLKLGERVFLVGTIPASSEGEMKKVVNEGIVRYFDQDLIETNISEKNNLAGSVLFDIEGNILGINKIDSEGRVISLPVSKVKSFTGF